MNDEPYDPLTPREWEVLALIRQGLTNEAIAERLGITVDGTKYHVSQILSKLGVSDRIKAARWYSLNRQRLQPGILASLGTLLRSSRLKVVRVVGVTLVVFAAIGAMFLLIGVALQRDSDPSSSTIATATATVLNPEPLESPTAPSSTATPNTTPSVEITEEFMAFVSGGLSSALQAEDLGFFEDRAQTAPITCTDSNTPSLPGGPACESVGQQFDGFPIAFWESEVRVVPVETALALIQQLFDDVASPAVDDFGNATAQVYGIGVPPAAWELENDSSVLRDEPTLGTLITALIQRPQQVSGTGPLRVSLVLHWVPEGDDFVMISITSAIGSGETYLLQGTSGWQGFEQTVP